jgi:hypothetical protein
MEIIMITRESLAAHILSTSWFKYAETEVWKYQNLTDKIRLGRQKNDYGVFVNGKCDDFYEIETPNEIPNNMLNDILWLLDFLEITSLPIMDQKPEKSRINREYINTYSCSVSDDMLEIGME